MPALNDPIYRSRMVTNIWGARLALDRDNMLVGPPAHKKNVQTISTTVPTTVQSHGYVRVLTSGSSQGPTQHQLDAPIQGVEVTLFLNSTSTGSQQFGSTAAGASIFSASAGTTVGWVNLLGPGGSITLVGVTTAIWSVRSMYDQSSTAGVRNISFTTST
jgi:hypothetical protein